MMSMNLSGNAVLNMKVSNYCCIISLFFLPGFAPSKAEQPLRGMELQEKEVHKG